MKLILYLVCSPWLLSALSSNPDTGPHVRVCRLPLSFLLSSLCLPPCRCHVQLLKLDGFQPQPVIALSVGRVN